jgi:hypothetical protein
MSSLSVSGQPRHEALQARIGHAIDHLKSLHDGEAGLIEVVGLGKSAIPPLRTLLFEGDPSGLHHVRCRAVEALAALGSYDVLADFLRSPRPISDAVERLGEDVVVSAAARAIARLHEDWVCRLLADLVVHRPLTGVLAGLGSFRRKDSIPVFIAALGEDDARLTAEAILLSFGKAARPALVAAALDRSHNRDSESESDLRRRRSALGLLRKLGISRKDWPRLRPLLDDDDPQIALLANEICLDAGADEDRARLPDRLTDLRPRVDWLARERIDRLLAMAGPARSKAGCGPRGQPSGKQRLSYD